MRKQKFLSTWLYLEVWPENKYQYFTQANINKLREAHYKDNFMNLEQGVTDYLQNYLLKKDRHA